MRLIFIVSLMIGFLSVCAADEYSFQAKDASVSSDVGENGKTAWGNLPDAGDTLQWEIKGIKEGVYRVFFDVRTGSGDPGTDFVGEYRINLPDTAFPDGARPRDISFSLAAGVPLKTVATKPTYKVIKGRIRAESLAYLMNGDQVRFFCNKAWGSVSKMILVPGREENFTEMRTVPGKAGGIFPMNLSPAFSVFITSWADRDRNLKIQADILKEKERITGTSIEISLPSRSEKNAALAFGKLEKGVYKLNITLTENEKELKTETLQFAVEGKRDNRYEFVVPGDDAAETITDMSWLNDKPAGSDGFVCIKDTHFWTDSKRIRFWGTNVGFGANFPTHEDAEKVAAHMAKLGINIVRFHHHDCYANPRGVWKKELENGKRVLDPEMLDLQDYFMNELFKRGIYANLNLHVSRTFMSEEGFPNQMDLPRATRYDKYLLYYMPKMRVLFKEFIKNYLLHENPYRKLRRIDDPAIAMLEITNENSFSKTGADLAASLPEPYRGEFKRQWNEWLADKYKTTDELKKIWGGKNEPLEGDIAEFNDLGNGLGKWNLNQQDAGAVHAVPGQPGPAGGKKALKLDIVKPTGDTWRQELQFNGLSLEKDKLYTLSFYIKGDLKRGVYADVSKSSSNWRPLGYRETVRAAKGWQHIVRAFRATESIQGDARICFKFGGSPVDIYLSDIHLQKGGDLSLILKESTVEKKDIEIPIAGWTDEARADVRQFMVDVEKGFVKEIHDYLKNDLGAKVPITASQISYHGAEIVAETCDYADIHGYWQHPRFPGKPWDSKNWYVQNTPMEQQPGKDTMCTRAAWRLIDRPFTVSEWNIPAPMDSAAGVVPFAAMMGGLQDWDAIFFFAYGGGTGNWFNPDLHGYFGFNGHPVKLALHTALARCFRQGDIKPHEEVIAGRLDKQVDPIMAMAARIGLDPKAEETPQFKMREKKLYASPDLSVLWSAEHKEQAHVVLRAPATRGVWGLVADTGFDLNGIQLRIGKPENDYAVIILTSTDGKPIEETEKIILVASGNAENQGMQWNVTRTSVSDKWGKGPTTINCIQADIILPFKVKEVWALDGAGKRTEKVSLDDLNGNSVIRIGEKYKTLWYEIVTGN